jgi:hypothetical protein
MMTEYGSGWPAVLRLGVRSVEQGLVLAPALHLINLGHLQKVTECSPVKFCAFGIGPR